MYDDASVEGEATSVDVLKSNVKNFEDGLAQELAALNASSNSKGVERAAAELAARVEEGDVIRDAGGRARGVIANKSPGALVVEQELRDLMAQKSPAEAKAELMRRVKARLSKSWANGGAK